MLYRISNMDKVESNFKLIFLILKVWNISVFFLKIRLFWKDHKTSNVMIFPRHKCYYSIEEIWKIHPYINIRSLMESPHNSVRICVNKVYNNFGFILFNKTFPSFNLETLMRKCVSFHSREKTPSDVNSWPGGEEKYKRTHWDTGSKCYLPYCLCSVKLFIACH